MGQPEESPDLTMNIVDDEDESNFVTTKKFGKLNFRTAETLLLNGGKSSISAKSRKARFTGDAFGIKSDILLYKQPFCGCKSALRVGDTRRLPLFSDPKQNKQGRVSYISYESAPLKFYCKTHSTCAGTPNVWLIIGNRYFRCQLN